MKEQKHANIPIFIPHLGCPNNCVFCNQRSISGHLDFDRKTVTEEIETALSTIGDRKAEIAFFGGSFTGIDRELMLYLLGVAKGYVDAEKVSGIRLSTRPDYIDREVLDILKDHCVTAVELGLQSMCDHVLTASKRGHDSRCAEYACALVKEYGFELVGQMMIGLPGSTLQDEIFTAQKLCEMGVDAVRVYPTVVFCDTELATMCERGEYTPISNEEAVERVKEVLKIFDREGVKCLRVGLCASENLASAEKVVGGANHSAIGELAMGEVFYDRICEALDGLSDRLCKGARVDIFVPKGATSKAVGQQKRNLLRLKQKYFEKNGIKAVKIHEIDTLLGYNIKIKIEGNGGNPQCT